jgi:hypothetical protein
MDIRGTITHTGALRYLSEAIGKKRVEKMCTKPGGQGITLTLYRVVGKESFFEADAMLDSETQPLQFR